MKNYFSPQRTPNARSRLATSYLGNRYRRTPVRYPWRYRLYALWCGPHCAGAPGSVHAPCIRSIARPARLQDSQPRPRETRHSPQAGRPNPRPSPTAATGTGSLAPIGPAPIRRRPPHTRHKQHTHTHITARTHPHPRTASMSHVYATSPPHDAAEEAHCPMRARGAMAARRRRLTTPAAGC